MFTRRRGADHEFERRLLRRELLFGLFIRIARDEGTALLSYALDNRLHARVVVLDAVGQFRQASRDHERVDAVVLLLVLLELLAELERREGVHGRTDPLNKFPLLPQPDL